MRSNSRGNGEVRFGHVESEMHAEHSSRDALTAGSDS